MVAGLHLDVTGVRRFVALRRKASGGYGATPRLPATIEDSFQAVAILRLLTPAGSAADLPWQHDQPLADYLGRQLAAPWPGIRVTAMLLQLARLLDLAIDRERLQGYLEASLGRDPSLETLYHAALLAAQVLAEEPARLLPAFPVRLPPRRTVTLVHRFLAVRKLLGRPVSGSEAEELGAWLRRSQNSDGGFGFFPATTSFVENCHVGLAALQLLGRSPARPEAARSFLLACQTGNGGFARIPGAAPFLDATWHGLAGLALLGVLRA